MRLTLSLAFGLAVSVLGSASLRAQEVRTPAVPSIVVEGVATREVAPDLAVISIGVVSDRPTAAEASAQTNRAAAAILDEVKANGVAEADLQTTQLSLTPLPDPRDENKTKGFRAVNHIAVRVRALATVGDIVGRLVDKGANSVEGIDFTIEKPDPILDGLRADATHDALHKAGIYAEAAGVKLGRVVEILPESTSFQSAPRAFKAQSGILAAAPAPVVQAGTQTLEARVRLTLELTP